ncbi:unnamed protein product [Rangifer tarandus platyrhynchus]|uniref:Uncharacterized protein n=1 Tax=Rangifer tarandus platyrhynchus TaxID=3082113 RepID=A0AC59Y079_RANTA
MLSRLDITFLPRSKRLLISWLQSPSADMNLLLLLVQPHLWFSPAKVSSPTETERCIESLIAVFQKHAGRDGNNSKLSKAEFLIFMNTELGAFTKNQKDPGVLDRMMKRLDLNSDGQLDFQEFLNLIGGLAIACHESFIKSASGPK